MTFKTDFASIQAQVEAIDPIAYGQSRNYLDGAVTYLSPYISRGVISTKQVLDAVLKRGYRPYQMESFVKELCWRDYFQRVGQEKNLDQPIKQAQTQVSHAQIPLAILQAKTGIEGIDHAIEELYQTGYMHNHARMYTASLVCNLGKSDWYLPAQWMYHHLLDGDWASNACSWQWVAAANSGKKYYANQENVNKYTKTSQRGTFLDCSYEALETMDIPAELQTIGRFIPDTTFQTLDALPKPLTAFDPKQEPGFNNSIYLYNYYNLDPRWHKDEPGQRILLLEPHFFEQYPISAKCWNFMLQLAAEIPNLQVFHGSFALLLEALAKTNPSAENVANRIRYKEHPLNRGYQGMEEPRDWIAPSVQGYYPSFFAYWKAVKRQVDTY